MVENVFWHHFFKWCQTLSPFLAQLFTFVPNTTKDFWHDFGSMFAIVLARFFWHDFVYYIFSRYLAQFLAKNFLLRLLAPFCLFSEKKNLCKNNFI